MIVYATLTQFRERLAFPAEDSSEDGRLFVALRQATAAIDRHTARRFAPVRQTRRYDVQDPFYLRLDLDLLALESIVNGDGSSINLEGVTLIPDGEGPKSVIRLDPTGDQLFLYDVSPDRAISVTGLWGTHDAWADAWRDSLDTVQDNPLSASATTLTVSDADGSDSAQQEPRFQPGHLLRIEDEFLHVTAVDADSNTLTVIRGVRGTIPASHAQDTAIAVYVPPQHVTALCLRWASWLYQQQNAAVGAGADWLYPPDVPPDLLRQANTLRRVRVA